MANQILTERKRALRDLIVSKDRIDVRRFTEQKLIGKLLELNVQEVPDQNETKIQLEKINQSLIQNVLHRYILKDIKKSLEKKDKIDVDIDVYDAFFKNNERYRDAYAKEGGKKYLIDLREKGNFTYAGFNETVNKFLEEKQREDLVNQTIDLVDKISDDENFDKVDDELTNIMRSLSKIQEDENSSYSSVQEILQEWHAIFYGIKTKVSNDIGLTTGFGNLDSKINGLRGGQLIVIGARPGMGKTAFVLNIMNAIAEANQQKDDNKKSNILMFSLEMNKLDLIERLISMNTGVPGTAIRRREMSDRQWTDVSVMINDEWKQREQNIFINDTAGMTMIQIEEDIRKLIDETGSIGMVVIDYLQLVETKTMNRQQGIAEISRKLKMLAKKYNVPIIALAQLNRSVESRQNHKPGLSDLRESGQIEQDADIVIMLSREDYYESDDDNEQDSSDESMTIAEIVKNRSGESGDSYFIFNKPMSLFVQDDNPERTQKSSSYDSLDNERKPDILSEDGKSDPFKIFLDGDINEDLNDFDDLFGQEEE